MSLKQAYKQLHSQLLINTKLATKAQNATELKKRIALLRYQKVQALRTHQTEKILELDQEIKRLETNSADPEVEVDKQLLEGLQVSKETEHNTQHIKDIANYLSYQRTYKELIERYNPGLKMTQEDKIRKTANRVGFELPEEFLKD